jgi:hypothetical protein
MMGGATSAAAAEPRMWTANLNGPTVMVTDCRNCGDDVGLMINCKGGGLPAEFVVPWAAMREGVEGSYAPVTIQIGSATFSYPAKTLRFGAIGYPPAFTVAAGDALFPALQSGEQATIRFGTATTKILLNGAGPAIESFKAHCGRNASTSAAPGQPKIAAAAHLVPLELKDEQGATWSFSRSGAAVTAVFGIPETDATSVAIFCANGRAAPVMEFFSAPARDRGTRATLRLVNGEQAYALAAQANDNNRFEASLDGSVGGLRRAMRGSEWVQVQLGGQPAGRFLGLASSSPGRMFLRACPQMEK